jgi:DNA-binding transcriptional LysR family regulator
MLDWNDLRYFLAIHRTGTLTLAARRLKVNASTVSRRLAVLEQMLGARLFDRKPKGYALTQAGRGILDAVQAVDDTVVSLERKVAGEDARLEGAVRITSTEALVTGTLIPCCARLHERHPGIDLEFVTDNQALSLTQRDADLAIRLVKPSGDSLVARKVGEIGFALYGSRSYLRRRDGPEPARGLAGHELVTYLAELTASPEARWLARNAPGARIVLRSNSVLAAVSAAKAGFGLALLPCWLGDSEPELRCVLRPKDAPKRDIWILVHPDLRNTPRVRAVMDVLAEELERLRPQLLGEQPKAGPAGRRARLSP